MSFTLSSVYKINKMDEALSALIDITRETQSEVYYSHGHLGSMLFLEQFATIRLSGPRRSGHSISVANIIKKHFNKSLILYHSRQEQKTGREMLRSLDISFDNNFVESISSVQKEMKGRRETKFDGIETIILDDFSNFSDEEIRKVYEIAIPFSQAKRLKNECFVLIFLN
jgi:hypothetical protein